MTDTIKVLGQAYPTASSLTALYTVPAATSATISSIVVCNQGVATTFNITVAPAGASDTNSQYLYFQVPLAANDTFITTIGITLATTDVVRVLSASGTVSFSIFGVQLT